MVINGSQGNSVFCSTHGRIPSHSSRQIYLRDGFVDIHVIVTLPNEHCGSDNGDDDDTDGDGVAAVAVAAAAATNAMA